MKFYATFLIIMLPALLFAKINLYDTNKTIEICAFDSISKQLAFYDSNGVLSVFDINKNELKIAKKFDNKITSLAFHNSKIYISTLNAVQILDHELKFLSSLNVTKVDKIYAFDDAKYGIKDKNIIINLNTKNSVNQGFGRVNELTKINDNICATGWSKTACYDKNLEQSNMLQNEKFDNANSSKPLIFTSFCQCSSENFISDINGNVTNLHTKKSQNLKSEVKALKCFKDTLFVATKDKIYKKEQENFKEVLSIKSGFLSMFASDDKLIVVTNGGEIYTI